MGKMSWRWEFRPRTGNENGRTRCGEIGNGSYKKGVSRELKEGEIGSTEDGRC